MDKSVKHNMGMYNSQADNRQENRRLDRNSTQLKNEYPAQSTMRHKDQNKNDQVENTGLYKHDDRQQRLLHLHNIPLVLVHPHSQKLPLLAQPERHQIG